MELQTLAAISLRHTKFYHCRGSTMCCLMTVASNVFESGKQGAHFQNLL